MAVLTLTSTEMDGTTRKRPFDEHGKLRFNRFALPAVAVAGDALTTIDLCKLPPGAVRILPWLSRIEVSAFGSSRVLDVGHRAYSKRPAGTDTAANEIEAEDDDAFIADLDVSSAVALSAWSATVEKFDIYSRDGVTIFAKVAGGTIPVGATILGYVAYLYE